MPTDLPEVEPTDDELLQVEDAPMKAVPVCIDTPVNTRELPTKFAGMSTTYGVGTTAVQLLWRDYRRKTATIVALSQDIILGGTQAQAGSGVGSGMRWPANVPLVINAMDEVWVASVTSTTDVSVIIESWAD